MSRSSLHVSSGERPSPKLVFWLLALTCAAVVSCGLKRVELPSFEGISLAAALSELNRTTSIEAVLSVEYEKRDGLMNGDAFLRLSDTTLALRLYYLGFLAGEVMEEEGVIRSTPKLDRDRTVLLVDGLRNCFLWWKISDFEVEERGEHYLLRNASRSVLVDRKTLLPLEQIIGDEAGVVLRITYDMPARVDADTAGPSGAPVPSDWYQSRITIRHGDHVVTVAVKSYTPIRQ